MDHQLQLHEANASRHTRFSRRVDMKRMGGGLALGGSEGTLHVWSK